MNRRQFLLSTIGVAVIGTAGAAYYKRDHHGGQTLTPEEAAQLTAQGEITLIDIRRPDEWARTGVPTAGHPIDMRHKDFIAQLDQIIDGDRARPVALICARGVRSDRMSAHLEEAGFTNIIDIPEGMLGSAAGPGWLQRGLPVTKVSNE